jgi:drug/metabolite transporter (DMT)-like permease
VIAGLLAVVLFGEVPGVIALVGMLVVLFAIAGIFARRGGKNGRR